LSVCGSDDREPIPFISQVYYFVTGDQTRSTIVSGIVCMPRMASPILLALDRSMSGANSCCDCPRRTDGDRGDDPFSLEMPEGRSMPVAGGIPPRLHDLSELGAIYWANQVRVATRGRGGPAGRVC